MNRDEELVRALCNIESGLNDWELNWVESVASQVLDDHRPLSAKQRALGLKILRRLAV